jgi:hypothetical protein
LPLCTLALCGLLTALTTGCGGGGAADDPAAQGEASPQAAEATAAAPAEVRLEGCLVDNQSLPAPAGAVQARTADGRLVGSAYSNADGLFVLRVPARASIALDTLQGSRGEVALIAGDGPVSVGACLQTVRA